MQTTSQAAILILLAGSSCYAQDAQDDTEPTKPQQQIRIILESEDTLPRMGTDETPILPTEANISQPHQTGLTQGQDWIKVVNNSIGTVSKPSALAEGSFLLSRSGRLAPAPNDRLIFVPAPDQRLTGEGPTLLLPCATLERLENIWANQSVTVSGEIMTYHGRNYLLISDFALGIVPVQFSPAPIEHDETGTETDTDSSDPESPTDMDSNPNPSQGLDEDPDVRDLLRELDAELQAPAGSQIQSTRNISIPSGARQEQQSQLQTAPPTLAPGITEGALLIRRPARLDRAPDGSWMAIFDNDSPTAADGIELTILPCSLLSTMEYQSIRFGDSARFVVSGRIYIHNNRGYLLPTFYQRLRTSDIKPWQ